MLGAEQLRDVVATNDRTSAKDPIRAVVEAVVELVGGTPGTPPARWHTLLIRYDKA